MGYGGKPIHSFVTSFMNIPFHYLKTTHLSHHQLKSKITNQTLNFAPFQVLTNVTTLNLPPFFRCLRMYTTLNFTSFFRCLRMYATLNFTSFFRCLRMYKTKNYKIAFKTYKANLPILAQSKGEQDQVITRQGITRQGITRQSITRQGIARQGNNKTC